MAVPKTTQFWWMCILTITSSYPQNVQAWNISFGSLAEIIGNILGSGQDCQLACAEGHSLVPKPGFEPTSNGCGTFGFTVTVDIAPQSTACCNEHDMCYGRCGADKVVCDRLFRTCLSQVCDEIGELDPTLIQTCSEAEDLALTSVNSYLGCVAFEQAQTDGCYCATAEDED